MSGDEMYQASELWENYYRDCRISCMLLGAIDDLVKEKKRLSVIFHQLRAKCESQRASLAT